MKFCFSSFLSSDNIAEQDISDLIVPPPQCEFLVFLFYITLCVDKLVLLVTVIGLSGVQ